MPISRCMITFSALLLSAPLFAATPDRSKPPETLPIPDVKVPNVQRFELPNGLRVVAAEDPRFPLTTFRIAFMAGSKYDPKDLPGVSEAVGAVLNQGTLTRNAKQIAIEAADAGGEIGAFSMPDILVISGSCLSANSTHFLELLADVARNASFPEDEVQLHKENRLQSLRAEQSQADYLGREALSAALYGEHPYSHIGPTERSLAALNRAALVSFRDSYLVPGNAVLIAVGKLPPADEFKRTVTEQFGGWKAKPVPAYNPPSIPANRKQLIFVDRPGSVQANIFSTHISPTYGSSEFFPLVISNRILGGGTNSRLFMDIREKRGFAYDAHTETDFAQESGAVSAVTEVRNEVVADAVQALNENLEAMGKQDVPSVELSDAKNSYAGTFILRLERQSGIADQLLRVATMGLPADYLDTYMTHIRSVEPDQVRKTAPYWAPDTATLVVVGDSQKIEKSLEKFGPFQTAKPQQ